MSRTKTPTFLLELPLQVNGQQAKHLRAHFEAARCLYNALLGEAMKRLKHMRADKRWQEARAIPKVHKQERYALFSQLRQEYGFSEYALHAYATKARTAWIADHLDSNTAQKLATRAYQAANKVCLGQARSVRFKSKGRGLDSVEGKTNKQGLRFVLQSPEDGNQGFLVWQQDRLAALIDWDDPVIKHGIEKPIKYARLLRRRATSQQAQGADGEGYRYYAQLAMEGVPYQKPKHQVGTATIGLDLGPSTLAMVPERGEARLLSFCQELKADKQKKRRLQVQRDLYSAFLAVHLNLRTLVPSIAHEQWESEGDVRGDALAGSNGGCTTTCECGGSSPAIRMGVPRAGARLPRSLASDHQELRSRRGRGEAVARWQEPPAL
jgi:hypothetical protein